MMKVYPKFFNGGFELREEGILKVKLGKKKNMKFH